MHVSERNLLGRWAPTQTEEGGPRVSQASSKHAMPNVNAAGNATCSGNLTIALKWSQSSAYSSPADPGATSCRPNVRGPQPSVFLFGEADDNSDFSESDDEVVHGENIVEGSAPAAEKRQRS